MAAMPCSVSPLSTSPNFSNRSSSPLPLSCLARVYSHRRSIGIPTQQPCVRLYGRACGGKRIVCGVESAANPRAESKFLIVEDNAEMRHALCQLLSDLGEVNECADGSLAFSAYASQRPDWVLMDIRLGQANGIQLTSEIKAAFPDARIVMVTVYDEEELREAARRAGACGYVLKEDLAEVRRRLLAGIIEVPE